MKKIIIFITIIFIQQTVYCQYSIVDTTANKNTMLKYDAAYFNKKATNAKNTAWFLVGTGIAMNLLAEVIVNNDSRSYAGAYADAFIYYVFKILYPVPIAASFFYFVNARDYKKKSKLILP